VVHIIHDCDYEYETTVGSLKNEEINLAGRCGWSEVCPSQNQSSPAVLIRHRDMRIPKTNKQEYDLKAKLLINIAESQG